MTKLLKLYIAEHEIAKTLKELIEVIFVTGVCLGTAPFLIWLSQL